MEPEPSSSSRRKMQMGVEPTASGRDDELVRRLAVSHTGPRLVYFAAERTLLSWVRSALGLMAFGFVVDRFGLFLDYYASKPSSRFSPDTYSLWMGTSLVVMGMIMSVVAAVRYFHFIKRYRESEDTDPGRGLSLAVLFTALISLAVSCVIVFLILMIR